MLEKVATADEAVESELALATQEAREAGVAQADDQGLVAVGKAGEKHAN